MKTQADGTNDDDLEAAAGTGANDDAEIADVEVLDDDDILSDVDVEQLDPDDRFVDAPDGLDVDGITPLPEQLTGRASGTDEDLVALFDNDTDKHLADGFRGGSEDEPPVDDAEWADDPTQAGP
jgi:hypothetical protein